MLEQRYSDNEPSKRDIPSFIEPRPPLIQNPFMRPRPQKGTNLLELFEEDSELEEPELVQVYLRLKPCTDRSNLYEVRSDRCLVTSLDTATAGHGRRTQHNVSKMYTFSRIFRPDCSQKEIFEQVVKDNLKKLPDGQSFTLLTYGASGSGKTYTLMGTVGSPGLVPRSLEYVFKLVDAAQQPLYKPGESGTEKLSLAEQDFELQWVKRLRHVSAPLRDKYRRMSAQLYNDMTISSVDLTNRTRYYVWVSFVEIYNEAIYDLLSPPDKRVKLRLREDSTGNVYVKGVTQAFVRSGEEAYDVMVAGKHNLVVAATGVHAQSSRSHCIFTITMLTEIDGAVRWSTVRLCDLAGSERARATRNTGARMQESRAINSSLHVLERCLHTLRRRQRHHAARPDALVPYRESKLTRLLGSGLSGTRGEAVSMVVTLNPSPEYAHETKHVLSLAAVAQDIQINNTMLTTTLESSTQDTTIESSAEVMRLRSENERLHFELVQAQARSKELMASMEARQQEAAATMRELVEEAKDLTRQYYEAQLQALRTEMEDMMEEYESRLAKNAAPPTDPGTPSRFLQAKVAELMTEIAVLEEKLTAERLARARAEKEVQHLRDCIEERDEKAFKENGSGSQEEIMSLTDSEHESDEENDIFNESLEPVFKKENLNKSQIIQKDEAIQNIVDRVENEEKDYNKSSDTLKDDSLNDKTEDSAYAAGDDESELSKDVDDSSQSLVNVNSTVDKNDTLKDDEIKHKTTDLESDICNNDVIEQKKDIKNEEVVVKTSKPDFRGTYCIKDDELKSDIVTEEEFKKPALLRGTYFVKETDKVKSPNNVLKSNINRHITSPFKSDTVKSNLDEQKAMKKAPVTLVSRIIKSLQSQGSDSSLRQFELLEIEANACDETKNDAGDFGELKFLKEKRSYFDDETNSHKVPKNVDKVKLIFENRDNESSQEFAEFRNKEKRTYFDNINVNVDLPTNKKITDIVTKNTDDRSPSIVKEHVGNDFEPSTIKKLLGESLTKPEFISSVQKNYIIKKHDSVDIFEGYDSPHISKPKDDYNDVTKSVEKLKLVEEDQVNIKTEIKLEAFSSIDVPVIEESKPEEILPTRIDNALTEPTNVNNTIDEFENICKDITSSRATEFDLLVSQEVSTVENNEDNKQNDVEDEQKQIQLEVEKVKYNLRNKSQSKNDKSGCNEGDVILAESQEKCESRFSTKRSLRLRRRKNAVDEELEEVKLKNIVNLQKEFSDVTMDMPATKKEVKDIPSPEKYAEEENVPPLLGIQSCPSKSVTRSRRKLFTPRAEPLDESLSQTGDSNERIRVPRPSYHRARARRKL